MVGHQLQLSRLLLLKGTDVARMLDMDGNKVAYKDPFTIDRTQIDYS